MKRYFLKHYRDCGSLLFCVTLCSSDEEEAIKDAKHLMLSCDIPKALFECRSEDLTLLKCKLLML